MIMPKHQQLVSKKDDINTLTQLGFGYVVYDGISPNKSKQEKPAAIKKASTPRTVVDLSIYEDKKPDSVYAALTQMSPESELSDDSSDFIHPKFKKEAKKKTVIDMTDVKQTSVKVKAEKPSEPETFEFGPQRLRSFRFPRTYTLNFDRAVSPRKDIRDKVLVSKRIVRMEDIHSSRLSNHDVAKNIVRFVRNVDTEKARMKLAHPGLTYQDERFLQALIDMRKQLMVVNVRVEALAVDEIRASFNPAQVEDVAVWLFNFVRNRKKPYKLISKSENLSEGKYFIEILWKEEGNAVKRKAM